MSTSLVKSLEKLDVKLDESPRDVYLGYLNRVLEKAVYKYEHRQTKNSERISWGRLIVQAISSGNAVLKDRELESLAGRVERLEREVRS